MPPACGQDLVPTDRRVRIVYSWCAGPAPPHSPLRIDGVGDSTKHPLIALLTEIEEEIWDITKKRGQICVFLEFTCILIRSTRRKPLLDTWLVLVSVCRSLALTRRVLVDLRVEATKSQDHLVEEETVQSVSFEALLEELAGSASQSLGCVAVPRVCPGPSWSGSADARQQSAVAASEALGRLGLSAPLHCRESDFAEVATPLFLCHPPDKGAKKQRSSTSPGPPESIGGQGRGMWVPMPPPSMSQKGHPGDA